MALTPEEEAELLELQELLAQLEGLQAKSQAPAAAAPKKKEPWYEDLGEGLGVSGLKTYNGIKDIWGGVTDKDRARLQDWRDDAGESGWGTAGEIAGDIGQIAVPGGMGLKAARGLGMASAATRGAAFGTDVALSTGLGALQAPADDESRWEGAAEGGIGAVVGGAVAKGLSRALRGIATTDAAKELMAAGIRLTPGQAANSQFVKMTEALMAKAPGFSTGTRDLRHRALADWNEVTNNMVRAPGAEAIKKLGFEAQEELYGGFSKAYDEAWAGAGRPSDAALRSLKAQIKRSHKELGPETSAAFNKLNRQLDDLAKNFTPQKMRIFDQSIKETEDFAVDKSNPYLKDAAKDLHDRFRSMVGDDVLEKLRPIDAQYRPFKDVQLAAHRSGDVGETAKGATVANIYQPHGLGAASRSRATTAQGAMGEGALQKWAAKAEATIGRQDPQALSSVKQAFARGVYSPAWMLDLAGRGVLGNNIAQRGARKVVDSDLAKALRAYSPSLAAMGGAYWQDD